MEWSAIVSAPVPANSQLLWAPRLVESGDVLVPRCAVAAKGGPVAGLRTLVRTPQSLRRHLLR